MSGKVCGYRDVTGEFARAEDEDLGTKNKFWLTRNSDKARFLFKIGHADFQGNAVENWAEVAAAELCERLDIPSAPYELAVYNGKKGTISADFRRLTLPDGSKEKAVFVMANQIMAGLWENYPAEKRWGVTEYTVNACLELLRQVTTDEKMHWPENAEETTSVAGMFCGYLMLDALIANSDRHHENWGFITVEQGETVWFELAPTFDHAASFCREPAAKMRERLNTKDKGRKAEAFCSSPKAKSAFFGGDGNLLSPLGAFAEIRRLLPVEAKMWMAKLRKFNPRRDLTFAFGASCGVDAVAPESREFALQMVEVNQERLLTLPE